MPLWDQVKNNLVEWYSVAADKTEELAKIGIRRYDKFGISRDIERQFAELGSFVYEAVRQQKSDFSSDPTMQAIIERITLLQQELDQKESEITEIKEDHRTKVAAKAQSSTGQPADDAAAAIPLVGVVNSGPEPEPELPGIDEPGSEEPGLGVSGYGEFDSQEPGLGVSGYDAPDTDEPEHEVSGYDVPDHVDPEPPRDPDNPDRARQDRDGHQD